jgi:hypothetical protein
MVRLAVAHVPNDLKHPEEWIARVVGVVASLLLQFPDAALVFAVV